MASILRLRTLREFVEPWSLETLPACETGMALLKRFADLHPRLWREAMLEGAAEMDRPALNGNPAWDAFTRHYSSCASCTEQ